MTDTLRILIADDELVARRRITRLVSAMSDVELVGECRDGEEVLRRLEEDDDVDVLLLDVQMPGLSGIETKALLTGPRPYVVFTTAHPEHAVEAFDVGATDYVLKPIEAGRLLKAIERARVRLATGLEPAGPGLDRLAIPTRNGVRLVSPSDVTHATFDGALVTVYVSSEALLTDLSLADLESRLGDGPFERVHRRALLNLEAVTSLLPLPTGGYVAVTCDGHRVDVSRMAARKLRRRLSL